MSKEISRDQINFFRTDLVDESLDNIELLEEVIEGRLDKIRDELIDKLIQFGEVECVECIDRWIITIKKGIHESCITLFSEAGFDLQLDIEIYKLDYNNMKRMVINLPIKVAKDGEPYLDSGDSLNIAKNIITTLDSCDNRN